MHHQPIAVERGAVAVEGAAVARLGHSAIVEVVDVVAFRTGCCPFSVDAQWR